MLYLQALFWIWAINFYLRSLYCFTGGQFGFYSHTHYALWPRVPWRPPYRAIQQITAWWETNIKAGQRLTGGWLDVLSQLTLIWRPGLNLIGCSSLWGFRGFQPIGEESERGTVIISAAGSGKSNHCKTILAYAHKNSPLVVFDNKGDYFQAFAPSQKRMGREVHGVDLEGKFGGCAQWNVFDEIAKIETRFGVQAATIMIDKVSEALVPKERGEKPHFPLSGQMLTASIMAKVYRHEPPENRHMGRFYQLLTTGLPDLATSKDPKEAMGLLWADFVRIGNRPDADAIDAMIGRAGNQMLAGSGTSTSDVYATVLGRTKWMAHQNVKHIMSDSTFSFVDMKDGANHAVYLMASTQAMAGPLAPFMRMITETAMYVYETIGGQEQYPTEFLLDEFCNIGFLKSIAVASPALRGCGVRPTFVLQYLQQIIATYPDHWRGFLGNAGYIICMGTTDRQTLEYICHKLGTKTQGGSFGVRRFFGKTSARGERVPVMTEDQLERFLDDARGNQVVIRYGGRPVKLKRLAHFKDVPVRLYEPDPVHGDSAARALFRTWLNRRTPPFPSTETPAEQGA